MPTNSTPSDLLLQILAQMRELKDKIDKLELAMQHRHADELVGRHGLIVENAESEAEILDLNGSCRLTRRCTSLRRTGECSINCIPHAVSSEPNGEIKKIPQLIGRSGSCKIIPLASNSKWYRFLISFGGDKIVSYGYACELTNTFYMRREDWESWASKHQQEHTATNYPVGEAMYFDVDYPVGTLILRVIFPPGYLQALASVSKDPFRSAAYFIRNTWERHALEEDRLNGRLSWNGNTVEWTIPRPVLGFRYAIHWIPLPAKYLESILD